MPTQIYECPEHGEFDVHLSFKDRIPGTWSCPNKCPFDDPCADVCGVDSKHVLKPPAAIIVSGGTGAGSGRR